MHENISCDSIEADCSLPNRLQYTIGQGGAQSRAGLPNGQSLEGNFAGHWVRRANRERIATSLDGARIKRPGEHFARWPTKRGRRLSPERDVTANLSINF